MEEGRRGTRRRRRARERAARARRPHALAQRGEFVGASRNELLRDEAFEPGFGDRLHDRRVIKFLRIIYFMPTWHTTCMIMRDILMILLDRPDYIPFHDLHMIDIIKKLEVLGSDHVA